MNTNSDNILNENDKEFIAGLTVIELEGDGVFIDYYDPESDNPFKKIDKPNRWDVIRPNSKFILEMYRKKLAEDLNSGWKDDPFTPEDFCDYEILEYEDIDVECIGHEEIEIEGVVDSEIDMTWLDDLPTKRK